MAKAELLLPAAAKGKTFFVQAVISHADGTKLWTASKQYDPPPMVDQQPMMLVNKLRAGTEQIHLNSKTVLTFTGYNVAEKSLLAHIDAKLRQTTQVRGRRATKLFGVQGMTFGFNIDGQSPAQTRQVQRMLNDLRFMRMMVTEDRRGNVLQQRVDVSRMRPSSRLLLAGLGTKMTESLDAVAIPLPGRTMKPGQTWRSIRIVPIDTLGTATKGSLAMKYTYKGLLTFKGRRAALIGLRGELRGHKGRTTSLAGRSRGFAVYDVESTRITYVRHVIDISLTITIKDVILKATGMTRVKLSRDPES